MKITSVRFREHTPLGRNAIPLIHVAGDTNVDEGFVKMSFDKDSRFVRIDCLKSKYSQLIPLSSIAYISVED